MKPETPCIVFLLENHLFVIVFFQRWWRGLFHAVCIQLISPNSRSNGVQLKQFLTNN